MSEETTTEQLAEIEGQAEDTPATEYAPPDGWRVVRFGEHLLPGDVWVNEDGTEQRSNILQWDASAVSGGRCIRRIKPEAQPEAQPQPVPEPEPQPEQYTPPEGWRVLAVGEVLQDGDMWVWPTNDQLRQTVHVGAVVGANQRYIRRIEQQPQPVPQPQSDTELQAQVAFLKGREVTLGTRLQQEREVTTRLRGELESVQNLLGTEKRRVTELEELVNSLRTINETQEKAFEAAGKENTALRNQLAAVKAELASVAADRQQLRVELDAAQQVPADSPEMRQLRADLAEVTRERDQYLDSYQRIFGDLETIRETTKAAAVEAIAEWLEPIRLVDSAYLANATMQHLPQIMRTLTGLDSHAID